jgi:HAD superfamily hydrolase (TIGR01484 family)
MHLFFDLDNTVTRSRSKIAPELKAVLSNTPHDVIIVSGAICSQIAWQVDGVPCYKLGQNGNHALTPDDAVLWEERLGKDDEAAIHAHIHSIPRTWEVSDANDLVQDRGCQISFSLLGHKENLEKKEAFDPHGEVRKKLLADFPFVSDVLDVKIGGTTCLDYTVKGKHKGFYVDRLIDQMDWKKEDCIYFGDMLFPGGNDESVIGVIKTQPVENPEDTLAKLAEIGVK